MSKRPKKPRPTRGRKKVVARGTPARWGVAWHPKALDEKNAIEDVAERVAIAHVIEKLEVDGPALQSPHQSGVMGEEGSGLRELRLRRGRSRWRPIFRRRAEELFAVLAIGPEAGIDKAGYARAVRLARQRLEGLEKAKAME